MSVIFDSEKVKNLDNSSIKILDFDINTDGITLFVSQCKVIESKQSTYTIKDCGLTDCTTINCTTIKCSTSKYTADTNYSDCSNDG